jgi:L-amino acid N-acyltransferase YncA
MSHALPGLRTATADDWSWIAPLLVSRELPLDGARAHLAAFIVATIDEVPVGCAAIEHHGDVGLLRSLAVSPGHEGRGVGRALLSELRRVARRCALSGLYLLTTSAVTWFASQGGVRVDRTDLPSPLERSAELRGACPAGAIAMRIAPADGEEQENIRTAHADDAVAIAAIYAPIVRDTSISFEVVPPSAQTMRERIVDQSAALPWLVAPGGDGLIAGYAYASRHRDRAAYRWSVDVSVYVSAEQRGTGIGRRLYDVLLERLAQYGYRQAFAGIALPNAASVALHEAVGFVALGIYRDVGFKNGAWHDVGWWQRALGSSGGEPTEPLHAA